MGFLTGSFSGYIKEVSGPRPSAEHILNTSQQLNFKSPDKTNTDKTVTGFVDWTSLEQLPTARNMFLFDDWIVLGVRTDYRSVPKAIIDILIKSELKTNKDLNIQEFKTQTEQNLIVNYPWVPSLQMAAWNLKSDFLICQAGTGKISTELMKRLGLSVIDVPLVKSGEVLLKLNSALNKSGNFNITRPDPQRYLPVYVPEEVTLCLGSRVSLLLRDEQSVKIAGLGKETKEEFEKLIEDGAVIDKLNLLVKLDYPEPLGLKLGLNSSLLSLQIPKVEGDTKFERLVTRLNLAQATSDSWLKVQEDLLKGVYA